MKGWVKMMQEKNVTLQTKQAGRQNGRRHIYFITVVGLMTALSIALLVFIPGLVIFPTASFLRYDAMDIPMILAGVVLGPLAGILVTLLGCAIQSLAFSADGIVGFFMHAVASGVLVMLASLIYRRFHSGRGLILGLLAGTLGMALVMIPLNLYVTAPFMAAAGVPNADAAVRAMLIPITIPFNLFKAGVNSFVTGVLCYALRTPIQNLRRKMEGAPTHAL